MKKLLIIAAILVFGTATAAAAQKPSASCSVTPNVVAANQTFTITATANVVFDFDLVDPNGIMYVWPQAGSGAVVNYQWATDVPGNWLVQVNEFKGRTVSNKHVIATCAFTVTP